MLDLESKFENEWVLWQHTDKNNWKIDGFTKLYNIATIKDFWRLFTHWDKITLDQGQYFIMKKGIMPIWEDKNNRDGGCWSYKINSETSNVLWVDIAMYLVSNILGKDTNDINGISLCSKKNNNIVIKIWNRDSKKRSLTNLNELLLKKWGTEIIYIAHIIEKEQLVC